MRTTANRLLRAALKAGKTAKSHKYGAKPVTVDGIRFASRAEARRYQELKLLVKAGEILDLVRQPVYTLHACSGQKAIGKYVADFSYYRKGGIGGWTFVVEDVKGFMTPLAKWKIKHVEQQHGITVEIVR